MNKANKREVDKAYRIIEKYGDGDMTHGEFILLLRMNDIDENIADVVARDLRPFSFGS
jgi:hypothetical protein